MRKIPKKKLALIIGIISVVILAIIVTTVALIARSNSQKADSEQEEYYTVSFDTDNGETIVQQKIKKGETVKRPKDPTKDTYLFGGWYSDKNYNNKFDFSTVIDENLTLYAKWTSVEDPQQSEKDDDASETAHEDQGKNSESPTSTDSETSSQNNDTTSSSPSSPAASSSDTVADNANNTNIVPQVQKVFKIVSTQIDPYSPDVKLSVTENGQNVGFSSIKLNGVVIATASSPYASRSELSSGPYSVTLSDGTIVEASL